jgi:hypothetical protein
MSLAQQQGFIALGLGRQAERLRPGMEDLAGATLRVEYAVPGGFEWVALSAAPGGRRRPSGPASWSPVRERSREAALAAARRFDPRIPEAQILPTSLRLRFAYTLGGPEAPRGMEFEGSSNGFRSSSFGSRAEERREQRRTP